ncbi:MAG: tRNA (adenosine(37)-N6)-dimethylallyltransferase MiaA [Actinomycetota bacterium]
MVGPTAAGKSEIALRMAETWGVPILSVDSMQVYRGLDIGTAKPTISERARIPHYMVDIVDAERTFTVAEFQREARATIDSNEHPTILVTGGSGLHFRSVVDPLTFPPHDPVLRSDLEGLPDPVAELQAADPEVSRVIDLQNPRRVIRALEVLYLTGFTPSQRARLTERRVISDYQPRYPFMAVGVDPGPGLDERIYRRVESMARAGLLEEVAALASRLGPTASNAVGYRQLLPVVRGEASVESGWEALRRATRQVARRQRTYFRRDPRITWIPWLEQVDDRLAAVAAALER